MATNTFNNMVKIARKSMDCLENDLMLAKFATRKYEDMFKESGAKQGDTINVRIPALGYGLRTGSAALPQGYVDTYVPVTLAQYGADMQFTTKELLLNQEDDDAFKQNVLNPLIAPVANKLDTILWDLMPSIPNAVGTPGTKPSNIDTLLDAGALLSECAVPRDGSWAGVLNPRHIAGMLKGTTQYFNPQQDIGEQYRNGVLGRVVGGFKISDDQNAPSTTIGAIGTSTPKVNGSTADGATQVVTDGWASGAASLKVGDVVTFSGVYAVNPVSKSSTGQLKQFVVTEAVTSTGADMTIKISPAITATGVNQNVSNVPANDADVAVWGDTTPTTLSGLAYSQSVLFHPDAMTLCAVDLPKPESAVYCVRVRSPRLNIPIRLIQYYNGNSDQELFRLDILAGAALTRPQFACRIVG